MKDLPEAKFHRNGLILMASEIHLLDGLSGKMDRAGGGERKDLRKKSSVLRTLEQAVQQIISVSRKDAYLAVQKFCGDSNWKPEIDQYIKRKLLSSNLNRADEDR